jgi:hypothetical protein
MDVRSASSGIDALIVLKYLRILGWDSPTFHMISRELLHTCSDSYGIFVGWCPYSPWATCHRCYTSRRCFNRLNTSASAWRRPGKTSAYSRAAIRARLLGVPKVKGMSQYSSCVYSMIIRSQLTRAVHCASWVHLMTRCESSW